ncbi:tetratricopeptide repeat protein [Kibdelosporangium persicum]|uniref:Transcriptional regulator RedD n=2 Tax=Kibdelosporangium persicum TaxID=2698649 RepID=A0ABX2EWN6_9PSEU|nr:Transcriptional regulator RedD [Kibdelosporangium persicum]
MVIVPSTVPKSHFVEALPGELLTGLRAHNQAHPDEEQIRLRMALHAGEIHIDEHGVVGRAVNLAFRLLDWHVFRRMQSQSDALLAVIASVWFYEEVIWHSPAANWSAYQQVRVTNKDVDTAAWIFLPDATVRPGPPAADPPSPVPRQLPVDMRHFAGRAREIDRLDELAESSAGVIMAIDGSAGIGKTTLVTHWAHRVKDRFPDGQLYVNLRGFDLREPMTTDQALHGFLLALGVAAQGVPADLDAKAALYRSLLVHQRMLIVLDNARSAEHVRPLLPGAARCMVLVTSRNRLDSLVVREGAHRIALDGMSFDESLALLAGRMGGSRLDAEPAAIRDLVDLCAGLPLALSIAVARVTGPISALVRQIRQERYRLDALDLGVDIDLNLRAVFSWSYEVLSPHAARLFRMLGLHPGPSIDLHACCAITGVDRKETRSLLNELVRTHLLTEGQDGRFRFHDLLRAYANELAEDDRERHHTAVRMLEYYVDISLTADRLIQPFQQARFPSAGHVVSRPELTSYADAMAWFVAEHPTLLAMVRLAADEGIVGQCWKLAWTCTVFLRRSGFCEDRIAVHRIAWNAAREHGDVAGQITSGRHLATALARLGRLDQALAQLTQAMGVIETAADDLDLAHYHLSFARIHEAKGDPATALTHAQQAWEGVQAMNEPLRRADALNVMGRQLSLLGNHAEALPVCERALALYSLHGNREGQAEVLMTIGDTQRQLGRVHEAVAHYRQAIDLDRDLGDQYWEAIGLEHLADARMDIGEAVAAEPELRRAVEILEQLRHPDTDRVRSKWFSVRTRSAGG